MDPTLTTHMDWQWKEVADGEIIYVSIEWVKIIIRWNGKGKFLPSIGIH